MAHIQKKTAPLVFICLNFTQRGATRVRTFKITKVPGPHGARGGAVG